MYVDIQVIGYTLAPNQGWAYAGKRAARYQPPATYQWYLSYKPDMSICTGSGGLLLSTLVLEDSDIGQGPRGSLALTFDAEAKLQNGQFDVYVPSQGTSNSTGICTGSTPEAIGAEIQRRTVQANLGKAANYCLMALVKGVCKCCKITSISTGKVLDIRDASTADGGKLQQWDFGGGLNQLWRLVPASPDSYIIISLKSSKVLDVPGFSTNDNVEIYQWGYHGATNQHWRVVDIGKNDYKIESVLSGKALDVPNSNKANGTPIIQYRYSGAANQRWRIDGVN